MRSRLQHLAASGALLHAVLAPGTLALAWVAAPAAAQTAGEEGANQRRYRQLIADAVAEFELGHWDEAAVLFREAHQLQPSAKTHRGLGQALFEARDYVQAIPHLQAALAAHGIFDAGERARLDRALDQAMRFVGRVKVSVEPEETDVHVDGSAVDLSGELLLNPGKHMLTASADGYLTVQQSIEVEGGATQALKIALVRAPGASADPVLAPTALLPSSEPEPPARAPREQADAESGSALPATLAWVSAGLALASFGTAVVTWRVRDGGPVADWDQHGCKTIPMLDDTCRDIQSEADGLQTASIAATVAGGVLAGAAIVLFVVAADDATEGRQAALRCGAGFASIACAGRF